jgi:hypothetical protein
MRNEKTDAKNADRAREEEEYRTFFTSTLIADT